MNQNHVVSCGGLWVALHLALLSDLLLSYLLSIKINLINRNWDLHNAIAQMWWWNHHTKKPKLQIMSPQWTNRQDRQALSAGIVRGQREENVTLSLTFHSFTVHYSKGPVQSHGDNGLNSDNTYQGTRCHHIPLKMKRHWKWPILLSFHFKSTI